MNPMDTIDTQARTPEELPGVVTRLFRAAVRRLDSVERAQARARSNGKVNFSG